MFSVSQRAIVLEIFSLVCFYSTIFNTIEINNTYLLIQVL